MVYDLLFDVQSLYILKNGLPIFHWAYNDKIKGSSNVYEGKKKDSVLISGFLSAIVSFANEIGIGEPRSYLTKNLKFSFLNENGFLFVVSTEKQISKNKTFEFLNIVSKTFVKLYDVGDIQNFSAINLSGFKDYLFEIITKINSKEIAGAEINKNEISNQKNEQNKFKNLIPKCYIDVDKTKHLSSSRRALFKLIDGNSSIFKIAEKFNDNPQNIFFTLRPYEKFGYIRINLVEQQSKKEQKMN